MITPEESERRGIGCYHGMVVAVPMGLLAWLVIALVIRFA